MLKVYGSDICIDCRNYKELREKLGIEDEYIDITENTENLREFLNIRDHDEIFDEIKEAGMIGIPLFVREDGLKTFDVEEVLSWIKKK